MKTCLKWTGIGLLAIILVVLVVIIFAAGPVVKTGVETAGPVAVGVPVTLEDADVRPLRGKVDLKELIIGNPEGYKSEYAFRIEQFTMDMKPESVMTDRIRINEIVIDGPEIVYEMSISGSNLDALLKGLQTEETPEGKPEEEPKEDAAPAKAVEIDRLVISNGKIRLTSKLLRGKTVNLPLPTIELKDIGKEKDVVTTTVDVIQMVIGAVVKSVTGVVSGTGRLVGAGAGAAVKLGAAGIGVAADAAGAGAALATDGVKAVGSGAGKALGAVGGLFKRGDKTNAVGDRPRTSSR